MDVVRSEAQRPWAAASSIDSQRGRGTTFTIHLPLTLAVTQVVLLTTGGNTYAVPSILVEQVLQLKAAPLADAYAQGVSGVAAASRCRCTSCRTCWATAACAGHAAVLAGADPEERRRAAWRCRSTKCSATARSWSRTSARSCARMPGIAGATVLGSGEIVLILEPGARWRSAWPTPNAAGAARGSRRCSRCRRRAPSLS